MRLNVSIKLQPTILVSQGFSYFFSFVPCLHFILFIRTPICLGIFLIRKLMLKSGTSLFCRMLIYLILKHVSIFFNSGMVGSLMDTKREHMYLDAYPCCMYLKCKKIYAHFLFDFRQGQWHCSYCLFIITILSICRWLIYENIPNHFLQVYWRIRLQGPYMIIHLNWVCKCLEISGELPKYHIAKIQP